MGDYDSSLRKIAGLSLIATGLLLFVLLLQIAPSQGIFVSWISIWPITICIVFGSLLLMQSTLRRVLRPLTIAFVLLFLWSMIFFIPLPSDVRLLLAAIIPLIAILLYRRYQQFKFPKNIWRRLTTMQVVGMMLTFVGLSLSTEVIAIILQYGLFLALAASMPSFLIMFSGWSLISGGGLKRALFWWLLFAALIMLPSTVLLQRIYQLISYACVTIVFVAGLLWYRRKLLSKHRLVETKEESVE